MRKKILVLVLESSLTISKKQNEIISALLFTHRLYYTLHIEFEYR